MADESIPRSGIYCIRNLVSGRVYVGSAANIRIRWNAHRSMLSKGKHHAPALRRSWLKHGPAAFVFEVLEIVEAKERLIEREQHWIDALNSACPKTGFNVAPKAGSRLGAGHSPETRALMKVQRKGRKMPPRTADHCAALSASRIGNQWAKGAVRTPETRAKISAAKKGRSCPWVAASNKRRAAIRRTTERAPSI